MTVFLLASCRRGDELSAVGETPSTQSARLFTGFSINAVQSLVISTRKSTVRLTRSARNWMVEAPQDFPAFQKAVDFALYELEQAKQGQPVEITAQDYARLDLLKPTEATDVSQAVEVRVNFDKGRPPLEFILGNFDFPDDDGDTQLYGQRATARRYVRILGENKVYLSASSFVSMSPLPSAWSTRLMLPVNNMRSVTVTAASGQSWTAGRKSAYGAIVFDPPHQGRAAAKELMDFFAQFMDSGLCTDIVNRDQEGAYFKRPAAWTIKTICKDGTTHTFLIDKLVEPTREADPVSQLSEGMVQMKREDEDDGLNYAAKVVIVPSDPKLVESDLVKPFAGRTLLISSRLISPLLSLSEKIFPPDLKP